MLKVLHVYPQSQARLAHYVSLITSALQPLADIRTAENAEAAADICREWQPDITHLHGPLTNRVGGNSRIVISAHGYEVTRNAYVVIARSPMEKEWLSKRYNRIEVVADPIITRTTTPQQAARHLMEIYQCVMHSNVLELMNPATRAMLRVLLKAGITGDERWVHGMADALQVSTDWPLLSIYAHFEGIETTVRSGIETIGMQVPHFHTDCLKCYLPGNYRLIASPSGMNVEALVEAIALETSQHQLPLSRIVDLHHALMSENLDEQRLTDYLRERKLTTLMGRILQIASEQTMLDQGYMPVSPIDDRQTQHLRHLITHHLKP